MKKIYTFALALVGAVSFGQNVVITSVVDGDLAYEDCATGNGSNPKVVELYVSGTVDLTNYRVQTESNGAATEGDLYWSTGIYLSDLGSVTNSFIYLVNLPDTDPQIETLPVFSEMYPNIPAGQIIYSTYAPNMNGNDAIRIAIYDADTQTANLVSVVDQFANPLDITGGGSDYGATWAYQDSYAKRNNNIAPNGGTFDVNSFTYGGNAALDGGNCETFVSTVNLGSYTLSNKSFGEIAGLSMYPNPLTGSILNLTSDANAVKTVAIYDILGKQVVNTTTNNGTVNVANLTAGVYIVKINEEGKTATRKLVVQ